MTNGQEMIRHGGEWNRQFPPFLPLPVLQRSFCKVLIPSTEEWA